MQTRKPQRFAVWWESIWWPTVYRSFLQIAPVVAEYKKLTGVDLTEYGFSNLFAN
jgi:hypothetical protein